MTCLKYIEHIQFCIEKCSCNTREDKAEGDTLERRWSILRETYHLRLYFQAPEDHWYTDSSFPIESNPSEELATWQLASKIHCTWVWAGWTTSSLLRISHLPLKVVRISSMPLKKLWSSTCHWVSCLILSVPFLSAEGEIAVKLQWKSPLCPLDLDKGRQFLICYCVRMFWRWAEKMLAPNPAKVNSIKPIQEMYVRCCMLICYWICMNC